MLELINRARANPQAEADLYLDGNLNEGLAPETISAEAKQPLVSVAALNAAAQGHTQDMIENGFFSHTGSDGSSPSARMTNAGYDWNGAGENLVTRTNYSPDVTAANTLQMHIDLLVDSGIDDRGHRLILMNPSYTSIGISIRHTESYAALRGLPSDVCTQDFGYILSGSLSGPFLTSVAYDDADGDGFYTPGEGLGGLNVTVYEGGSATEAGSTATMTSGGYGLELAPGSYDVEIGGPLGTLFQENVELGSANVKLDYTNDTVTHPGNRAPVMQALQDRSVDEGDALEFVVFADDPDGDSLTFSAFGLPDGATFNPLTQTLSWIPNYAQAGLYGDVRFEVSDGSLTDFDTITITVNQPYEDSDANADGAVNVLDMIVVGQNWGAAGVAGWHRADVNEDGSVNVLDLIRIGQR